VLLLRGLRYGLRTECNPALPSAHEPGQIRGCQIKPVDPVNWKKESTRCGCKQRAFLYTDSLDIF